jgi:hypothetical protein
MYISPQISSNYFSIYLFTCEYFWVNVSLKVVLGLTVEGGDTPEFGIFFDDKKIVGERYLISG